MENINPVTPIPESSPISSLQPAKKYPWIKISLLLLIIALPFISVGYIVINTQKLVKDNAIKTTSQPYEQQIIQTTPMPQSADIQKLNEKDVFPPTKDPILAKVNNSVRKTDIQYLLDAIMLYMKDHEGSPPAALTNNTQYIAKDGADICEAITPKHIMTLPRDPRLKKENGNGGGSVIDCNSQYTTGFTIVKSVDGKHITITAPLAEQGETILVTN